MNARRFGQLEARAPGPADEAFLEALYLETRADLGALPVPMSVIEGIARHQRQLQHADYARRYPALQEWLVLAAGRPVARVALEGAGSALRVVDLSVARVVRRNGIARSVLTALQAQADSIALRVRSDNSGARRLYEALGFSVLREEDAALELGWRRQAAAGAQNE